MRLFLKKSCCRSSVHAIAIEKPGFLFLNVLSFCNELFFCLGEPDGESESDEESSNLADSEGRRNSRLLLRANRGDTLEGSKEEAAVVAERQ